MTTKTYKHFIDGVHVATYKQSTAQDIKRAELVATIKTVVSGVAGSALVVALVYVYLLVM